METRQHIMLLEWFIKPVDYMHDTHSMHKSKEQMFALDRNHSKNREAEKYITVTGWLLG